ncbi:MAG TPA: hypothetical protein VK864_13185 [Longimicrobiales bacterium]|nr:hypothetical protein [Longimicrobiales bacterium]
MSSSTAPAANAELPAADISIQLSDYEFKLSKPVTAGRHTFRVRN